MAPTQTQLAEVYPLEYEVLAAPLLRLVEPPQDIDMLPTRSVAEMAEDEWSRRRAERLIQRAGAMALDEVVQVEQIPETMTLMEAIHQAAQGNQEARNMVAANVRTEAIEITYKAGFVIQTELQINEQGQTIQFGQTAEDMQLNSLRYASNNEIIRPRSQAEVRNSMRIEDLHRQGLLDDYYFVVFSRCADGDDATLSDLGFFAASKSTAIQATTKHSDGSLVLESAFVSGVLEPDAVRHDVDALEYIGNELGVEFTGDDAKVIDTPVLIPKNMVPNGVVDIVKDLWDPAVEAVTGHASFYGQQKPKQDYQEHRQECQQKQDALEHRIQIAVDQLLEESKSITDPAHALLRLHKITERAMIDEAAQDASIDVTAYGREAAFHVEVARAHFAAGDHASAQRALNSAYKVARSSSCPSALRQQAEGIDANNEDGTSPNQAPEGECKEVKNGEVVNCPFCKKKVKAIVPSKEEIFCSNSDCTAAHSSVKKK